MSFLKKIKSVIIRKTRKQGGVLSDMDIKKHRFELFASDIVEEDIQPASVDLHLSNVLKKLDGTTHILSEKGYELQPGEFILGSTSEYVTIPNDIVAQVDGKSSIARLGVLIHITAGFIDPGFNGNITLEIKNITDDVFLLTPDMLICQIVFFTLTSTCEKEYGHKDRNNHYQNSESTILSRKDK